MANVVMGDVNAFKAAVYGESDWRTSEFLSNQYSNLSTFARETSQDFFKAAHQMYEKISGSTAMRMARQASVAINGLWNPDDVRELITINQMQLAQATMQRWIMANPVIRNKYHKQEIDGYSDSYIDLHPNDVGEYHYDYRRVMNGIAVDVGDRILCTTYPDDLNDEKEMTHEQQSDIINTWDRMNIFLKCGIEDPTSKWANELF